jgi:DNA-binding MarR family transcriptional regulator
MLDHYAILACVQLIAASTQPIPEPAAPRRSEDLAVDLYAVVMFMHRTCNADLLEALGELELTLTQIKFLAYLEDTEDEVTLKRAAELAHVSLPGASRMVDDLVRRGFVERREDPEDRRMKRVRVTESARAVIRRINAARLSGLEEFTRSLSDSERRALSTALDELLKRPEVAACMPELAQ